MWRLWVGLAFAVWFAFGYYTGQWMERRRTLAPEEVQLMIEAAKRVADQIVDDAAATAATMVSEAEIRAWQITRGMRNP